MIDFQNYNGTIILRDHIKPFTKNGSKTYIVFYIVCKMDYSSFNAIVIMNKFLKNLSDFIFGYVLLKKQNYLYNI